MLFLTIVVIFVEEKDGYAKSEYQSMSVIPLEIYVVLIFTHLQNPWILSVEFLALEEKRNSNSE
jgi:hypothetical protein